MDAPAPDPLGPPGTDSKVSTFYLIEDCVVDEPLTFGAFYYRTFAASEEEMFLIRTFGEMKSRLAAKTAYDLFRLAGLLRQLFCDDRPLVHMVCRRLNQKLTIELPDHPPIEKRNPGVTIRGFFGSDQKAKRTSLDSFLNHECIMIHGDTYTVLDVIKICANKRGGIHFDPRRTDKENKLIGFSFPKHGLIWGKGSMDCPGTVALYQIGSKALQIIEPLVPKIEEGAAAKTAAPWWRKLIKRLLFKINYGTSKPRW
ncbi:MAG: hypothetical protein JNG83_14690 [Opitutaceae bacterium]|nr:hypothetical protein [Opitutaceae bacterium]